VSIVFYYNRLSFYILAIFILMLVIQLGIHWIRFSKLAFFKRYPRIKRNDELEPVSIVVCARDAYEQLTELIPALLSQDYPQFEVVVVNDCSDDETEEYLKDLERREPRIKPVQLRQHLNFFNGKKFPLSMGIKSASYDLMVLTDFDCMPTSEQWLRSMVSCYDYDTEMVIGYSRLNDTGGLLNKLMRFETLQNGVIYLSSALAGKPYTGVGKNLSYRQRLFFRNKGFTSHYGVNAGEDDIFISQVATKKNTKVQIDDENTITSTPAGGFSTWARERCNKYSTIPMHRLGIRLMSALHYWSQLLFYASFITLFFLSPAFSIKTEMPYAAYYFPILVFLFLLRYITQMIIYRGASKRLGERGLLPGLILWDLIFAVLTPLFRITGRMTK
jgi:glycosyltransferase involved in cell wall biosynthesis